MAYDKERFYDDLEELRKTQPFSSDTAAAIAESVWPKIEEAIDEAVSEGIGEYELEQRDVPVE